MIQAIPDLSDLLTAAVTDVFATMLNTRIKVLGANQERPKNSDPMIASAVGFVGGLNGVVYVYAREKFACEITSMLLGPDHDESMVNDAMGELANMTVGYLKSRLSDRGMSCVLTIPSIVRGSSFVVEPVSSDERQMLTFASRDNWLWVEILIKPSEAA